MKTCMKTAAAALFGAVMICGAGAALSNAAPVRAEAATYSLQIGGTDVTDANKADILGDGVFSYNPATKTLDIHGNYYAGSKWCVRSVIDGLTINVTKNSILTSDGGCPVFDFERSATITGVGKLHLHQRGESVTNSNPGVSLYNGGELTIRNIEMSVKTEWNNALFGCIYNYEDPDHYHEPKLTIINSDVTLESAECRAIATFHGGITLQGCHTDDLSERNLTEGSSYDHSTCDEINKVVITCDGYKLKIDGKTVKPYNQSDIRCDGTVSYDNNTKTLTLNGSFSNNTRNDLIDSEIDGLTINVAKNVSLRATNGYSGMVLTGDTLITGPGSLYLYASDIGIYEINGKLTIKNTSVYVSSSGSPQLEYGITGDIQVAKLDITNSSVHAFGTKGAVSDFTGGVTLNGVIIDEPENAEVKNGSIRELNAVAKTVNIVPDVPAITAQPTDVTVRAGEPVIFSVQATGSGLTYQWQYNNRSGWRNMTQTGTNPAAVTVTAENGRDGQQFRCIISNQYGASVTSEAACLKVKPTITTQPQSVTVNAGETAVFSVAATGNGVIYQWQYKSGDTWRNAETSDARTNTLSLVGTAARDGKQYRCITKSAGGGATISNVVTLKVRPVITSQPQGYATAAGGTAVFRVSATGVGLIYQWQYKAGNTWKNAETSDARTNTLRLTATEARDGNLYRCIVKTASGAAVISDTVMMKVKPVIIAQPLSIAATVGATVRFKVTATGHDLIYQWQVNTGSGWRNSNGAGSRTDTLSFRASAGQNGYQYRCIVKAASGAGVYSDAATLFMG